MLNKPAVVLLAALLCLSGCASMSRTNDLRPGMTADQVDSELGSPEQTHVGEFSGKETRLYRLYQTGTAGQIAGGLLTFGMYPFLFPGKSNYYALFDKDGKLIAYSPSGRYVAAQTFVGLNASQLYQKWGAPTQQQQAPGGGTAYVYVAHEGSRSFSTFSGNAQTRFRKQTRGNFNADNSFDSQSRGVANTDFGGSGQSSSYAVFCRSTFLADKDGKITSAMTEGNNCD